MNFAENLTHIRKKLGMTRKEVAEKMGITPQAYSCYEYGRREPRLDNIVKLAEVFGVSTDALLMYTSSSYPRIKNHLQKIMPIAIKELGDSRINVTVFTSSNYNFAPSVNMSHDELMSIYERARKSSHDLESGIREIIIDEYAMAIFENHKELRVVDILPDIDDIVENHE